MSSRPSLSHAAPSLIMSLSPLSTHSGLAVAGFIGSPCAMKLHTTVSLLPSVVAEVRVKYSLARRIDDVSIVTPSGTFSVIVTVVSGLIRSAS